MERWNKTRPAILDRMRSFPHGVVEESKPRGLEPRFVSDFKETLAWQRLKDHKYAKQILLSMSRAFKLLGNIEPRDWTLDDVADLRKPQVTRKGVTRVNDLYNPETKDIKPEHATNIRRALKDLNLTHLLIKLEDVEKGNTATRRNWFLNEDEIKRLLANMPTLEDLMFVVLELQCGARPKSMVATTVADIVWQGGYILYYESKKKTQGERFFIPETFRLLQRYISDLGLSGRSKLFSRPQGVYSETFKQVGISVGIPLFKEEGAAAYVLRHTFATQASHNDVSLDVVMRQGGWSESSTLLKHYVAIKPSKMKRELLGVIEEKPKNFGEWIRQFVPIWEKRYNELLQAGKLRNTSKEPKNSAKKE